MVLSEEMFTEELQEVSAAIASLASGASDAPLSPHQQPTACLSEEATQGVSETLNSIGSSAKATFEKLVETASTAETPAPFNKLSVACMSDDTQVVQTASPRVEREKSLVDEEDKPDVDDVKETTTCLELSEQMIHEEMKEMSATIASFGLGSSVSAEKHPKECEERPKDHMSDAQSAVDDKGHGSPETEIDGKDKANLNNDTLVESMAAERANCGCVVM
jgi:hypothetical protein